MEKHIGVIESVRFGKGGYQESMLGLSLSFKFDTCCGVNAFVSGGWTIERSPSARWTELDRGKSQAELCTRIIKILDDAKVDDIAKLKGKPVELTLERGSLRDWRILTEAIL